jgi:acetoin utilization protein AcuC
VVDVVPRLWTHLVAVAAHAPIEPAAGVPEEWHRTVYALTRREGPRRMTDGRRPRWRGWEDGYDPADATDRAILATRRAVYPLRGLLP